MSDTTIDRLGSPADRKITKRDAATLGSVLGLVTGAADWLILNCYASGHWHYVPPDRQLIDVAGPIILLPAALWFGDVFSTIGDIILNKLKKDDA